MAGKSVDKNNTSMARITDISVETKRILPPIKGYENERMTTLEIAVKSIIPFVPEVEQMVFDVKQRCQQPKDKLTSDESASIMLYTLEWEPRKSSFYYILNEILRTEDREQLKPWFLYLRLFIWALAKLPSTKYKTIYRGIKQDIAQKYHNGQILIWWGFTSCASSINVLKGFLGEDGARTIFNIECESAIDIHEHSCSPKENELLMYPARQFKVISSLDLKNKYNIIQLEEIRPTDPLIYIPKVPSTTITTSVSSTQYINQHLIEHIQQYERRSKIDLSSQSLNDEDMNIVAKEAILTKKCTWLSLEKNNITSFGVSIIANALDNNTTLKWIDLSYNKVSNTGVQSLSKILSINNSQLGALNLWSSGITDEGAEYLAEMLKTNTKLTHLGVPENKIGDVGVHYLANVLTYHNNALTHLDLSLNKLISDSSIDCFVEMLKQNRSLTNLSIEHCNLSSKGKERLQQNAKSKNRFDLIV